MPFFDWYQLAAVTCLACLGLGRAIMLRRRGIRVLAADPQRSLLAMLCDLLTFAVLVLFFSQTIAFAVPGWDGALPDWMKPQLFEHVAFEILGAVVLIEALVVYGLAVRAMGDSWRMGIDRSSPGPLITGGIFAFSRNPIYVALVEFFIAYCLIQGRLAPIVLTAVFVPLIHNHILREERFLSEQFGDSYRDYRSRVGRYFSWPRKRP